MPLFYSFIMSILLLTGAPSFAAEKESPLNCLHKTVVSPVSYFKSCLLGDVTRNHQEVWSARRNLAIASALFIGIGVSKLYQACDLDIIPNITQIQFEPDNPQHKESIKNQTPQEQEDIKKQINDIFAEIEKERREQQEEFEMLLQAQLQQTSESPPVAQIITPPTDPIEKIKKQLAILYGGLNLFLQKPNDTSFNELKDIYRAYLITINDHKDISDTILALPINGSPFSGESLCATVLETLKKSRVYGYEINPLINTYNEKMKNYDQDKSDKNLVEMHFALLDIAKRIYPTSLEKFFSAETANFPTSANDFATIDRSEEKFLELIINNSSLLTRLKQYPGFQQTTKKSLEKKLRKLKK